MIQVLKDYVAKCPLNTVVTEVITSNCPVLKAYFWTFFRRKCTCEAKVTTKPVGLKKLKSASGTFQNAPLGAEVLPTRKTSGGSLRNKEGYKRQLVQR
eukprot:5463487-Amphidinium_carterae.1